MSLAVSIGLSPLVTIRLDAHVLRAPITLSPLKEASGSFTLVALAIQRLGLMPRFQTAELNARMLLAVLVSPAFVVAPGDSAIVESAPFRSYSILADMA